MIPPVSLSTRPAKVYIVGAGPGHPELLTVKAAELLKNADVVVYDRLIQEEVLALAKPSAERIYMGKPIGKHDSRQEEIHALLLKKAGQGKLVVRLKGGDPFVFGRGGEEAEYLADHGIPFEVIPGVSSALAAPLSAGIALTHRDCASSLAIVTGHEAKKEHAGLDWLALSHVETLVFLMAVNNLGVIAQKLMAQGKDPDTPAALIQMAFWHNEQVVTGTLATIADDARRADIKPPATLVVGQVVRLREKLSASQRDLRRRPDDSPRFDPAPGPDQLLRLATAGVGSQVLRFALALGVFDQLDEFRQPVELAGAMDLRPDTLTELLDNLVALGLLEGAKGGYRNLEIASRYLKSDSSQNLRAAVLHLSGQSDCWQDLARYVFNGRGGCAAEEDQDLFQESCESLARFSAPAVADKLDLGERSPVLLLGWGGDEFRRLLTPRWASLALDAVNPFLGQPLPNGSQYGAVLVSGLLASCKRGEVGTMLETAATCLRGGGLLALYDSLLPAGALPSPEAMLGGLARRISRDGCRDWSVARLQDSLHALGLTDIRSEALPAGMTLVTARKPCGADPRSARVPLDPLLRKKTEALARSNGPARGRPRAGSPPHQRRAV